jgi:hypothetical protein
MVSEKLKIKDKGHRISYWLDGWDDDFTQYSDDYVSSADDNYDDDKSNGE